jgi:hypothetical protein
MAGVRKGLARALVAAGVAVSLLGCTDLLLKASIRGLVAPSNVSGLKVKNGATRQFKLSWKDPSDADVASIEISFQTPFTTDAPPAAVTVPIGTQAATVTVPYNNVQYIMTVKTIDKAGNKSAGVIYAPITIGSTTTLTLPFTQAPAKTYKYYSTPFTLGVGTLQSTDQYTYDPTTGLLTEDDNYNSLAVLSLKYTYTYNADGTVKKENYESPPGTVYYYYAYTYNSSGMLQVKSTVYPTSPSQNYSDVYEYDANGNMTKDTEEDSGGNVTYTITYTYDSYGRWSSWGYVYSGGSFSYNFEYDPTTNLPSKLKFLDSTGAVAETLTWAFASGVLTQSTYDSTGTFTGGTTASFNSHGLLTSQADLNSSRASTDLTTYNYDQDGNTSAQTVFSDPAGTTYSYQYTWSY